MISSSRIYKGSSAELITHKKTRVISVILLGFAGLIYGFSTSSRGDNTDPSPLGIFIYFTSLIPLFSCCIAVFRDMHDIPTADVQMSMPLSNTERYLSRLLTLCRIWFIPFLISAAAAMLLSCLFAGTHYSGYFSDYDYTYHPSTVAAYNFSLFIWFLAAALFIISATVLCQCCIGSRAESRYMPVMVMFVLSVFTPAVYSFVTTFFGNTHIGSSYFDMPASLWTFSGLFSDSPGNAAILLINCIISLAVIFGGMFICRRRDARTVGMPIVFPLFFEAVTAVSLVLFFLVSHTDGISMVALFLAWLGSIILRIVVSRKNFSFSKVGIWTVMYLIYYAVFLIFMYIAFLTGGFGSLYKTPSLSDYSGYEAQVQVCIDKKYSYYESGYYSDNYDEYDDYESDFSFYIGNAENKEKLHSFIEEVSDASSGQSRLKGFFTKTMFGGSYLPGTYECNVSVRITKTPDDSYGDRFYSINFSLDRSGAEELIRLTDRYEGQSL